MPAKLFSSGDKLYEYKVGPL